MRQWHYEARFMVDAETLDRLRALCSPSGKYCWVSNCERLRVHTLRGVPGKLVDVLLPDALPADPLCVEIGRKVGSYDGAVRWRITLRTWAKPHDPAIAGERPPDGMHPGPGRIDADEEYGALTLIARWWGGGLWAQSFRQLAYQVSETTDRRGILLRHWKDWYRFLQEDEVRSLADVWACLPHTMAATDIVVLNRTASAALYDLAVALGWRKLTLRERRRLGLADDSPQWHRADSMILRRRDPSPSGCGQYTLDAAGGRVPMRDAYGAISSVE